MLYVDPNGNIIKSNQPYTSATKKYGADYPKDQIPELHLVTETERPTDPTVNVTGFTVNENYEQVWTTEPKSQEELAYDLGEAKIAKKIEIYRKYIELRESDIEFTASDASTRNYQTDKDSTYALQGMLDTYKTTTPDGFYWVASDNARVPFTRADLENLAFAIGDRANTIFQTMQDIKQDIIDATTIAEVKAIEWNE